MYSTRRPIARRRQPVSQYIIDKTTDLLYSRHQYKKLYVRMYWFDSRITHSIIVLRHKFITKEIIKSKIDSVKDRLIYNHKKYYNDESMVIIDYEILEDNNDLYETYPAFFQKW